jgi:hypothetical protein
LTSIYGYRRDGSIIKNNNGCILLEIMHGRKFDFGTRGCFFDVFLNGNRSYYDFSCIIFSNTKTRKNYIELIFKNLRIVSFDVS